VRVSTAELSRLAAFCNSAEHEFIQLFTRLRHDRLGLALNEKPDGSCIFLHGSECAVNPVKPQQCRDFPNLWQFPGFENICKATGRHVDLPEYMRLVGGNKLPTQ
jgi:uncharacterized protein